jgi:flagellar secretion chaperone FliS
MNQPNPRAALQQYANVVTNATTVGSASPHEVVRMLLNGALDRIAVAKGSMQRNDFAAKGMAVGKAISIIAGLRKALDHQGGGEIAANLELLYDYIERRLAEANRVNDVSMLDEVANLLGNVRSGWESIPPDVIAAHRNP